MRPATQPPGRGVAAAGLVRAIATLFVGAIAALVLAVVGAEAPSGARPLQVASSTTTTFDGTSTTTVTTTENLLVGETTVPATTAAITPTTVRGSGQRSADNDARTVWYIVWGLVAVAFAILVMTVLYWRRTRPKAAAV